MCNATCGASFSIRTRICVQPRNGGEPCAGLLEESKPCTMPNCAGQ